MLRNWHIVFLALLGSVSVVLLVYTNGRRLLHVALDDRYGEWLRAWRAAGLGFRLDYAITFFFCHGLHDLMRLGSAIIFDLFVLFALLSPFWRYLFFEDWNPALAAALGAAGVSVYLGWKLRSGAEFCWVHGWSEEWQCNRCGEYHAQAEERAAYKKSGKASAAAPDKPLSLRERLSWHGFWARRLEQLNQRLDEI